MATASIVVRGDVTVVDYRCDAGPGDVPFPEAHNAFTLSYVRRGGFAYTSRGRTFELVAGSFMIGHPGDEYVCSHEHHLCGDECLSFHLTPEAADEAGAGAGPAVWRMGGLAPQPALAVWAERAQAVVDGRADGALDELGLLLTATLAEMSAGGGKSAGAMAVSPADRRRAVRAAMAIDAAPDEDRSLASLAADAGLSQFHFLRVFAAALGVTPHQYVLRSRLRRAAKLLADRDRSITDVAAESGFADLSNFVRTFHRAAGMSPRRFQRASRKILQERPPIAPLR